MRSNLFYVDVISQSRETILSAKQTSNSNYSVPLTTISNLDV